ncbi:6-methylsalicylic acid decarboxylase atA [Paramyrothecium foliicola]|nr:6-methylsalicylic acid decarboxylase atA [Paramyrothecium foliicola]
MASNQIRVAIIGGGPAGATLANALFRIPHIAFQLLESAPMFYERGSGVGLSDNARLTLKQTLGSAKQGSGSRARSLVLDFSDIESDPELIVHRASLLGELFAPLPKEVMHPNNKRIGINPSASGVNITFEDGTVQGFDAIIGADGVFGVVRDHVLETEHKRSQATPAGLWDCRVLVPIEKVKAALGEELFALN